MLASVFITSQGLCNLSSGVMREIFFTLLLQVSAGNCTPFFKYSFCFYVKKTSTDFKMSRFQSFTGVMVLGAIIMCTQTLFNQLKGACLTVKSTEKNKKLRTGIYICLCNIAIFHCVDIYINRNI